MKVVEAIWEKRNLGVDVVEIQCAQNDSKEELVAVLQNIKVPYSVCKIPGGATELLLCAQEQGYQVIEMSLGMDGRTKDLDLPAIYKRFAADVTVKEADSKETKMILAEIESGNIFKTDRIALDPYFGNEIAGKRYGNWVRDLIQQGAHVCIGYYKETPIVFGINIDKAGAVSDAVLGGILNTDAGRGMGFLALYANLVSAKKYGNKKIKTSVSSNNPAIINLHLQYGYKISEMHYVLVKHQ